MKRIFILMCAMGVVLFSLPVTVAFKAPPTVAPEHTQTSSAPWETVSLYLEKEQKVLNLKAEDYLTGVLFAEMDPQYEIEALKAQAVVSYTYYLYTKNAQTKSPDTTMLGAYISDNPSKHQGYMQSSVAKEKFADKYSLYLEKITSAIDAVSGVAIKMDNEPILSVFHHSNAGQTNDAATVWGKDYKYLKSVESKGDALSPNISETVKFDSAKLLELFTKSYEIVPNDKKEEWFSASVRAKSGTIEKQNFCSVEFTGQQLRSILSLKSANFDVSFKDDIFTFTVYGYGHGVGMSQYGADYMARQGSSYTDILSHYFTDVVVG